MSRQDQHHPCSENQAGYEQGQEFQHPDILLPKAKIYKLVESYEQLYSNLANGEDRETDGEDLEYRWEPSTADDVKLE